MSTAPPAVRPDAGAEPEALIQEARRRQRRRYLLTGSSIALALAVAAGVTVSQLGPGGKLPARAVRGWPAADTPVSYARAPAYYANTVQGDIYDYFKGPTEYSAAVPGRYLKIRDTGTGKMLARITPPKPWNNFALLTSDAAGRLFVFGATRYWDRGGNPSVKLAERDQRTPMKFLVLRIASGRRLRLSELTLPEAVTPGQRPSIALSPDGTRLAVASGGGGGRPGAVEVIRLATGQSRRWVLPHVSWTPSVTGRGAWTANGQTLVFEQVGPPPGPHTPAPRYASVGSDLRVRLLDTAAPGTSLAASKLLALRLPAGQNALGWPVMTPDGTKLIGPVGREPLLRRHFDWRGELAEYSTSTGALLRTVAPWTWSTGPGLGNFPSQVVAWSNRSGSQLVILQPRNKLNDLGVLTGNTFTQADDKVLPGQPPGYRELQYVLRSTQATW
jgi:hypothetical protein